MSEKRDCVHCVWVGVVCLPYMPGVARKMLSFQILSPILFCFACEIGEKTWVVPRDLIHRDLSHTHPLTRYSNVDTKAAI